MGLKGYIHASEILTGEGVRKKNGRRVLETDLGRIRDGAIIYSTKKVGAREIADKIEWLGPSADLPKKYLRVKKTDLKLRNAIIPGMIDCHTHMVFAGDRSDEFAARCGGATYQQIAEQGGGIIATVKATRAASAAELERIAIDRIKEAASYGVKTFELKSGYGLSVRSEIKLLEVGQKLKKRFPELTFTSTFLGAHAFPQDRTREEYLSDLVNVMIPEVVKRKLADACDVFIDKGYYTLAEGEMILKAARKKGLRLKIHADELVNTESAYLAAEMGALSADHLLKISDRGIKRLAKSETVAVLLPGTAFYLKAPHAPARKLIDSGACVAISTDFNPGTSMTLSLPSIMTIAALYLGMTRAELFASVTYNAAKALGLEKSKGSLAGGMDADFSVLPFSKFEEIYYRFAWSVSR